MIETVRLALFGAGNIGARHLALAAETARCEVIAVADPLPAAAKLAAAHGARFYTDFGELLEQESPDGAIVATPNDRHAEVALACIERGVPVLVEKPIADTLESAAALVAAGRERGVAIAVGHHRRFDPVIEVAFGALRDGRIGRLVALECLWSTRKHDTYYDAPWRRRRPSGGPVLINLIHDIDLIVHLCGDIVRVHAESTSDLRGNEVEDAVAISVRFASGAVGTILASDTAPSPWGWELGTGENPEIPPTGRNCYRFLGTEGALALPRLELWRHAGGAPANWHEPIHVARLEARPRSALKDQLADFCRVVRGETTPRVSGAEGLRTLGCALAILDSMASGGPVEIANR